MTYRRLGFTLIELSMVLVIIGLVAAGVLVGQELILAGKRRALISQVESYQTAAATFRSKYNCIPGDCARAVSLGLGASGGPGADGDGNGIIYSPLPSGGYLGANWPTRMRERLNFWYHLRQAGLIEDNVKGHDQPAQPADMTGYHPVPKLGQPDSGLGAVSVDAATGTNDIFVTSIDTANFGYIFNVMDAFNIDSKVDDGKPNNGKVRTSTSYGRPRLHDGTTACAGHALTNDLNEYDLKGNWRVSGWEAAADMPNTSRIECGLAFLNAF